MKNYSLKQFAELITNVLIIVMFVISLFTISNLLTIEKHNKEMLNRIERYVWMKEQTEWVKAQQKLNKIKWVKEGLIKADVSASETSL